MVFFSSRISPAHVHRDLLGEVAVGDGGGHLGDVAHLAGQVARHRSSRCRSGPSRCPTTPSHLGLPAQLSFGADLPGHAGDFGGEGIELIHHRVDGVLQLQDLASDVDGDLLGEVAVGDGGGDLGDVADLAGQVARPWSSRCRSGPSRCPTRPDLRLAAQLALGSHLAGHAGDFGGEGVELIHHRVDGVLQLQDLAPHVDGDLLGEVAVGDGGGDFGDVADLAGQVARPSS